MALPLPAAASFPSSPVPGNSGVPAVRNGGAVCRRRWAAPGSAGCHPRKTPPPDETPPGGRRGLQTGDGEASSITDGRRACRTTGGVAPLTALPLGQVATPAPQVRPACHGRQADGRLTGRAIRAGPRRGRTPGGRLSPRGYLRDAAREIAPGGTRKTHRIPLTFTPPVWTRTARVVTTLAGRGVWPLCVPQDGASGAENCRLQCPVVGVASTLPPPPRCRASPPTRVTATPRQRPLTHGRRRRGA